MILNGGIEFNVDDQGNPLKQRKIGEMANNVSSFYNDILNNNDLSKEEKAFAINQIGEAELKRYDDEYREDIAGAFGRAGLGAGLMGASMHPILNIPYVGTGLGGAMFEWGNSINNNESVVDTLKNMGKGFLVGEAIGMTPLAAKGVNTLSGGRIGNGIGKGLEYVFKSPLGEKISKYGSKVGDALMKDVNPYKKNNQSNFYDYLKNDSIFTKDYAKNKEVIDNTLLPYKRKIDAGINPFEKIEKTVLYDSLTSRDEWIKIGGKDYRVLNLPKKDYGKIMHIIDTYLKPDDMIGEVIIKSDDMYKYTFQKISPIDYKFIGRKKIK